MEFASIFSAEPSADKLWRGKQGYEKECDPLDTSRDPEVENPPRKCRGEEGEAGGIVGRVPHKDG